MRNYKWLIWLFSSMLALSFALLLLATVASAETLYVCTSGGDLNGRARPDPHARIEMKIPNGDSVEAVSRQNGWVQVIGGETGTVWCAQEYLSSSPQPLKYRNTSGGRVFVRRDIKGAKTGLEISSGKVVTVRRQMSGWGYVGTGWVDLDFFTRED